MPLGACPDNRRNTTNIPGTQCLAHSKDESSYSLRADILCDLLKRCTSVKTVRLCLQLGLELSQSWIGKLDPSQLPKGSNRPWVSRSAEGLLVLKP
jgi:hypothetical protein